MQVSIKKVEELLKAIGVQDAEIVSEADDKDVKIDDFISQIDANRSTVIEPQLRDTVKGEFESGFKARMLGTLKSAFGRSGVKLTDEFSSVDDMVKKALDSFNDKFSQDSQSLRDEMTKLINDHAKALNDAKDEYEKEIQSEKDKSTDKEIDEILQGYIKEIPRVGGDDNVQARQVKQYLREQYHLAYDPNEKKVQIRQKDKPEQPVYNEQKTKLKEVSDVVKEWCDKIGITASDTRHNNPTAAMNNNSGKVSGAVIENQHSLNPIENNDAILKSLME